MSRGRSHRRLGPAAWRASLALAGAVWLAPMPSAHAKEVDVDGRVALRTLFSADGLEITERAESVFIAFVETDARATNLTDGGLTLVLDGTFVLDATDTRERRFGRTESLDQIRQAYVEQPGLFGDRLDVALGRRLIAEAGNGWVDGLELRLRLEDAFVLGAYGGLAPDPIDYALVLDRQATGVYAGYLVDGLDVSVAYNAEFTTRDAETVAGRTYPAPTEALDRHFGFGRVHLRITDALYLSTYALVDLIDEPQITTLLGSLDFKPTPAVELSVNVSRYALAQYRDEIIYQNVIEPNQALLLGDEVLDLSYDRARFSAAFRFAGSVYQYQSIEYKRRSLDGLDAWHYTLGIRDDDLFGVGTRADIQTQLRDNFVSDSVLVALDVQHDLASNFTVEGRFTWFDGKSVDNERARAFDEAQRVLLMGLSAFWRISRQHQVDVMYDGIYETELQDARNDGSLFIHTGMARYNFLF